MAILQISKIQQRSGNLVDLPQLDEAEFGWASDQRRLFIGKTTPNENVEVLTGYSIISFSQIDGAVGNLNITASSLANGEVLAFDGTSWVNRGGNAGGLITLGDASDVKITGGATGFVLQTDGTGNLSWTPKATIIANIQQVTQANPAVVTTTEDNFFTDGTRVTITNAQGMTQLNGNSYYANVITSNTFSLYSDSGLSTPIDSSAYTAYAYTSVSGTTITTNRVTVGSSTQFTANAAVSFIGNMSTSGITANTTYYVYDKPTGTTIRIATSADGNASNILSLQTTTGLTANVYQQGGRTIASVGGSGGILAAAGANTTIQFNNAGVLAGSSDLTYDSVATLLTVNGNANVGNLNSSGLVTGTRLVSNIATGTTPLQVTSTTRVANLNVAHANVSDYGAVTTQTTGTFYPIFVSANTSANYALASNANISFNAATGLLTTSTLAVTGNANVGNLGTSGLIIATGNVSGGNLVTAGVVAATGNVSGGNLVTGGVVAATGNVTGGNLVTAGALSVTGNANVGNLGTSGLIIATGNVSGGNLTTAGVVAATGNVSGGNLVTAGGLSVIGNANVGNLGTSGLIIATGNVSGGNLVTSGVVAATGNVSGSNVVATSYHIRSITTGISAAGSTQGTATALTKEINVVSTVSSGANGVVLPTASAGIVLIINNTSANTLSVYPATGGAVNSGSTNAAYSHVSGASIQYYATSGTQWYTVGATFA